MPYILEAKSASLLSAGVPENQDDRAVQQHLTLIETAIRHAAANGHNRVPLLGEKFVGWDKNDIRTGPLFMSQVFKALAEVGYRFHTEHSLEIACEAGRHKVPYVHTVVTWPKTATATPVRVEATPWCPDDGIAEGFRGAGKTELLNMDSKALLKVHPLTREERTKIADSIGKDLEYVDPALAQPTSPSPTAFTPSPLPMPGTPIQLIEYLRQKGYKMEGFGCLVEVKHKPTNRDTCRAIAAFVMKLVECHKYGSESFSPSSFVSLGEYPDVDLKYLQGAFAEVGIAIAAGQDWASYRWPSTSWDYTPVAPVAAKAGEQA